MRPMKQVLTLQRGLGAVFALGLIWLVTTGFARGREACEAPWCGPNPGAAAGLDAAGGPHSFDGLAKRLAASIPALAGEARPSAVWPVSSCADSGPGSLRQVVADAGSGDTVYFGGLGCSITLTSYLLVTQNDLTLQGGGMVSGPEIKGSLRHAGTGTLTLDHLVLSDGSMSSSWPGEITGGCVSSAGNVLVQTSRILSCTVEHTGANAATDHALGGGIYAAGVVAVIDSDIGGHRAEATAGVAAGGAIFAGTGILVQSSTIRASQAVGPQSEGGGLFAIDIALAASTISSNNASVFGGGLVATGSCNIVASDLDYNRNFLHMAGSGAAWCRYMRMSGSTVTKNSSNGDVNGLGVLGAQSALISNSTIADNVERRSSDQRMGALSIAGNGLGYTLQLHSTVISGNRLIKQDHSELPSDLNITNPGQVLSSHNLIGWAADPSMLAADTIWSNNPGLAPLAANGGPTMTMAIQPGSPLLDRGANPLHMQYDQRRAGYVRRFGRAPDIGAFELHGEDGLFADDFEAEPEIFVPEG